MGEQLFVDVPSRGNMLPLYTPYSSFLKKMKNSSSSYFVLLCFVLSRFVREGERGKACVRLLRTGDEGGATGQWHAAEMSTTNVTEKAKARTG